jgi:signal peptidase II
MGFLANVERRWKILIGVGLIVSVLDQVTKFLVIENLTPGMRDAHFTKATWYGMSPEEQRAALEQIPLVDRVGYFYGGIREPCRLPGSACPTVPVIDGFWNFRYVENPGAAWGLMAGVN